MDMTKDLPDDLKKKLAAWEANSPAFKQLQAINELRDSFEQLVITLEQGQTKEEGNQEKIGALLTDMRESLVSLKDKESPETPDFAKPIVDTLTRLEETLGRSIKAINVTPEFKPSINVDSPRVNVPAVDISGITKILKSDLPKAFNAAIKLIPDPPEIPETDFEPVIKTLKSLGKKLDDIDRATRMKPQPGVMGVKNPDGSYVYGPGIFREFDDIEFTNPDGNGNYQTVTFLKDAGTLYTLTLDYDTDSKVTSIVRT